MSLFEISHQLQTGQRTAQQVLQSSQERLKTWEPHLHSFLYIDECVEGTIRLMRSDFSGPVNSGSEEMVTINGLARMVMRIAVKDLSVRNIPGPTGVRGRNSDNRLTRDRLGWAPSQALADGLAMTYRWIERQVLRNAA